MYQTNLQQLWAGQLKARPRRTSGISTRWQDPKCLTKVHVCAQVTKEEVVQTLRRQSKGFQKTSSQYRGVTRHQKGKWEARIGQMAGKKYKCAPSLPCTGAQHMRCHLTCLWT